MVTSDFKPEVEIWPFCACSFQLRYITLIYGGMSEIQIYGGMSEILASYRKSGSRNTMVTSDFRLEVKIWPTVACKVFSTRIIRVFYF